MKMIKGAHFKLSKKLKEEYKIYERCIIANVSAEHIEKLFSNFLDMQDDPLFLIIEIPTNKDDEDETANFPHKDVYYADGLNRESIYEVMNRYGGLFINDGLSQIGIGNHITGSEIMTDKYNVIRIFWGKEEVTKYEGLLLNNGIKKNDELKIAWDYFDDNNPGISSSITENGMSTYDVTSKLKEEIGLYYAERRED